MTYSLRWITADWHIHLCYSVYVILLYSRCCFNEKEIYRGLFLLIKQFTIYYNVSTHSSRNILILPFSYLDSIVWGCFVCHINQMLIILQTIYAKCKIMHFNMNLAKITVIDIKHNKRDFLNEASVDLNINQETKSNVLCKIRDQVICYWIIWLTLLQRSKNILLSSNQKFLNKRKIVLFLIRNN